MAPREEKTMQMEKISVIIGLRHKKDNNEKKSKEKRSWSDLPKDILEYIMATSLCLSDITPFHAVCKRWRSIECPPNQQLRYRCRPTNQIPWLIMSNSHNHLTPSFTLIDPSSSHMKTHTIKIEGIERSSKTQVCSTKFGWMLLSCSYFGSDSTHTSFFFYSPFINERIDLPDLDSKFDVATFSSVPTSPDCIIFVLRYTDNRVNISIYRQGDKAWSTISFFSGFFPIKNVVYLERVVYCSTSRGRLATFDIALQSGSVLSELKPLDIRSCENNSFMIGDDNGELFHVLMNDSDGRWVYIHKLDRSKMEWVQVDSLTDKSLFVCSSTSVVVSKNKRTKRVMNRMYYCQPYGPPKFYSFKAADRPFRHFSGLSKENDKNFFWIEPPC